MSSSIQKRRNEGTSPFGRLDRMFDEWFRTLPMRRLQSEIPRERRIRVDELREGDTEVIRAELAGIDPQRDVEVTVADGTLRIEAQRRIEEKTEDEGYLRQELRYGSFTRTLPIPDGASEDDITATYKDGILEVRVPMGVRAAAEPTRIVVQKD